MTDTKQFVDRLSAIAGTIARQIEGEKKCAESSHPLIARETYCKIAGMEYSCRLINELIDDVSRDVHNGHNLVSERDYTDGQCSVFRWNSATSIYVCFGIFDGDEPQSEPETDYSVASIWIHRNIDGQMAEIDDRVPANNCPSTRDELVEFVARKRAENNAKEAI